ncbi:MAG: putative toxin-antitoxin system toxin component, PIN family [Rhodanobacteraceae bacterium]
MRAAVIDTNVVASGLITGNPDAPPARIVDAMCAGTIVFVVSSALLSEYRDVLNRPKLRKRHGLTRDEIETLLVTVAENAVVLQPTASVAAPEPGDQHLWDLLASHESLCLVTGDALLLHAAAPPAPVISAADFLKLEAD